MSSDGNIQSIHCTLEQHLLDELVKRTVEAVRPLRIILFGSAARGEMGPDSDIDLLVVMPEGSVPTSRLVVPLYSMSCETDGM